MNIKSSRLPHVKNLGNYLKTIGNSDIKSKMGKTYYDAFLQWIPK